VGTVTAITHYSTDANGDDQVVVTAQYGYPLLLPGLQGVRTGRLSDGKLQITVQAAGLATTSVPTLTASFNGNPKNSGNGHSSHIDVQVTTPQTRPPRLQASCLSATSKTININNGHRTRTPVVARRSPSIITHHRRQTIRPRRSILPRSSRMMALPRRQ
jgi:hypothetical protein